MNILYLFSNPVLPKEVRRLMFKAVTGAFRNATFYVMDDELTENDTTRLVRFLGPTKVNKLGSLLYSIGEPLSRTPLIVAPNPFYLLQPHFDRIVGPNARSFLDRASIECTSCPPNPIKNALTAMLAAQRPTYDYATGLPYAIDLSKWSALWEDGLYAAQDERDVPTTYFNTLFDEPVTIAAPFHHRLVVPSDVGSLTAIDTQIHGSTLIVTQGSRVWSPALRQWLERLIADDERQEAANLPQL